MHKEQSREVKYVGQGVTRSTAEVWKGLKNGMKARAHSLPCLDAFHLAGQPRHPTRWKKTVSSEYPGLPHSDLATLQHLKPQLALCGYTDVMFRC